MLHACVNYGLSTPKASNLRVPGSRVLQYVRSRYIAARITVFSHSFSYSLSVALCAHRYVRFTKIHFFSKQLSFAFNYEQTQDYEMCVCVCVSKNLP